MPRGRWVTPDTTGDSDIARCLSVPINLQPSVNWALEQLTFADSWEQVGDLTPVQCAAAMQDVLDAYYESVCDVPQLFPLTQDIFWRDGQIMSGNALAFTQGTGLWLNGEWHQQTAAINDELRFRIFLKSGFYYLTMIGRTQSDCGEQTWPVDNVAQSGSLDWYSAAQTNNVVKSQYLEIPESGDHVLESRVQGKNASSSNYYLRLMSGHLLWNTD